MQRINNIDPAVLPTSTAKIDASIDAFEEHADVELLMRGFDTLEHKLTPSKFLHWMRQQAKAKRQRIVLPEALDHRVLAAAASAQAKGYADIILLGKEEDVQQVRVNMSTCNPQHDLMQQWCLSNVCVHVIRRVSDHLTDQHEHIVLPTLCDKPAHIACCAMQEAAKIGVDISGITIVNPVTDSRYERYIEELMEARKKKGLTRESAEDLLSDGNYFGTIMVRCGDADGLVSGAAHTTAATVRPGMQVRRHWPSHVSPYALGTMHCCLSHRLVCQTEDLLHGRLCWAMERKAGARACCVQVLKDPDMPLVSSIFFMCLPDKGTLLAALPTHEEHVLLNAIDLAPSLILGAYCTAVSTVYQSTGGQLEKIGLVACSADLW